MPAIHFYCVLCGTALETSSESRYDLLKCSCCARYVPVPRPARGPGNMAAYPPVFPPEVLELLVKFQCTTCRAALHADARCEGREVVCSTCGAHTAIPRWSTGLSWPTPAEAEKRKLRPLPAEAPVLSVEEIDFLRGPASGKPEAAA